MGVAGNRRRAASSLTVILLASGILIGYAVAASGRPVDHVDLNDGGVWVANTNNGYLGRINTPAHAMDVGIRLADGAGAGGPSIDVQQQDAAVVGVDPVHNKISPVDVRTATTATPVSISPSSQVALAGGTVAVFDPASGKVWGQRVQPDSSITTLSGVGATAVPVAKGLASTAPRAGLAVSENGTIYVAAVTQSGAVLAKVAPSGSGFASQSDRSIPGSFERLELTTVGSQAVLLDPASGTFFVQGGASGRRPELVDGVLQQAGPASDAVLVATPTTLWSVDLVSGALRSLHKVTSTGPAARPVSLGGFAYGAWSWAATSALISPTLTR